MRRLRVAGIALLGVLVVAIAAAALALDHLSTSDDAQRWLGRQVSALASAPGSEIRIARIGGNLVSHVTIEDLALGDRDGDWATIDRIAITWAPLALLGGRITVRDIHAGTVTVRRAPAPGANPSSGGRAGLPLAVALDRLAVDRLVLDAPVAGEAAVLSLSASARLRPDLRDLAVALDAQRIDDRAGGLALRLRAPTGVTGIDLALGYEEPEGGLLARMAALPGLPPVAVKLEGAGDIQAWRGRLTADVRDLAQLDSDVTVELADRLTIALDGSARIDGVLPPDLQPLLGDIRTVALWTERGRDGTVTVAHAHVAGPLADITVAGRVMPTLDVTAALDLPDVAPLSGLAGQTLAGGLHASLRATGDMAAPTVAAAIRSDRLVAGANTLTGLAADLSGSPRSARLTGSVASVEAAGAPPIEGLSWIIEADQSGERLEVSRLSISTPLATIEGTATLGLEQRQLDASMRVTADDLGLWRSLTGLELAGRTQTDLTIAGSLDSGLEGDAVVTASDLVTHLPVADALLGGRLDGRFHIRREPDGTIRIAPLEIATPGVSVRGDGELVDALGRSTLHIAVPKLAPLGRALGTPLGGGAKATVELEQKPGAITARLVVDADANGVPARLGGHVALEGQRVSFDDIRLEAAGTRITGRARLALASGTVDGNLAIAAPNLAALSKLAGTSLAGQLQGRVKLAGERAGQRVELALDATKLGVGGLAVAKAAVNGTVTDALRAPRTRASVTVAGLQSGATAVTRLELKADGGLDALNWSASAQGKAAQAFTVDAGGQLGHRATGDRLTVQRLSGQFAAVPVRLAQPTTLERKPDAVVLAPLRLELGKGRVQLSASRRGDQLAGTLEIQNLPLAVANAVTPLGVEGELAGTIRVAGTLAAPDADVALELRRLTRTGNGAQPIDGTITAAWHRGEATVQGRIGGLADRPLTFSARAPIAYQAEPFSIALAPSAPISGRVEGIADLRRVMYVLGVDQSASGRATINLSAGGTRARPQISGTAELADGRFTDATSGVTVDALSARLAANGTRLELVSLSATDGHGGRLSGRGAIDFAAADPAFDGTATLSKFGIRRDEVASSADATLRFGGSAKGGSIDGAITVGKTEATIPDKLPVTLVKIDVVEVNGGRPQPRAPPPAKPATAEAVPIKLAMTIDLPGPVIVRGRGLDADWRGRLTIGGTAAKPEVLGNLTLVRGWFDFLGKRLTLSEGKIEFPGGDLEPFIDVKAIATSKDLTATIQTVGKASRPNLVVTSEPPLPQDEILAHVLFDKRADQLSTAQAIQLAQAVAQLTGGSGGGLVDRLRKTTGLDVIDLKPVEGKSGAAGQALSVGKYVGNRVMITGEQGITPNSSRGGVEVNVTDQLSVKTDVGASADSRIGLNWKLDY